MTQFPWYNWNNAQSVDSCCWEIVKGHISPHFLTQYILYLQTILFKYYYPYYYLVYVNFLQIISMVYINVQSLAQYYCTKIFQSFKYAYQFLFCYHIPHLGSGKFTLKLYCYGSFKYDFPQLEIHCISMYVKLIIKYV